MNKVKDLLSNCFLNFGSYFKYSFKTSLKTVMFILAFGIVVYLIPLSQSHNFTYTTNVGLLITYVACLCYIVPIFQMNYLKKKRILDCYYSLPIDKKGIVLNNYLIGLLEIIIPYIILYWAGFIVVYSSGVASYFRFEYYVPLFFVVLLSITVLYTIITFVVSQNNTNIDACISLVFYTFILSTILSVVSNVLSIFIDTKIDSESFSLFYPFVILGNYYNSLIMQDKYLDSSWWDYPKLTNSNIAAFIVLGIMGVISFVLLLLFANKSKAENAEEISLSPFSYTSCLPIYLFCGVFAVSLEGSTTIFIWIFIILAVYLVLKVIQYRKIKLSPKVLILPVIIIIIAFILGSFFGDLQGDNIILV